MGMFLVCENVSSFLGPALLPNWNFCGLNMLNPHILLLILIMVFNRYPSSILSKKGSAVALLT